MKLSVNLFMTLNGVSQAPGAPQEDTRGEFTDGGWLFSVWDDGCANAVSRWFDRTGALLLGRRTFDTFAAHWPQVTDPNDVVANVINNGQKYVVTSSTLGDTWAESSTVLSSGVLEDITKLKETDSELELQVHGSVQLARTLHGAGLVDIYRFLVVPVVVGPGVGIFDNGGPSYKMNVHHSAVTQNGVFDVEMTPESLETTKTATVQDGQDVVVDVE